MQLINIIIILIIAILVFSLYKLLTYKDYSIEYYPLSKRYYATYGIFYLKKDTYWSGLISRTIFVVADNFETEQEAEEYIALHKEQHWKANVIVIKK